MNGNKQDCNSIARDLFALGVRPGGVLLVHSSLRSLGPVAGGAETVVQGLLQALGPNGTLLMPGLSYQSVGKHNPVFDVLHTPSCVGALPEYFRSRPGSLRSVHPTHSVSGTGARAPELLADHAQDHTPCGSHSPFARLPGVGGQVLFLGCGMRPNTSMHAIEEHVEPPYLYGGVVAYEILLPDGTKTSMQVRSHNFVGVAQRYDRLENMMGGDGIHKGQVLEAACFLVDSEKMWAAALTTLRADPLFFVEQTQ